MAKKIATVRMKLEKRTSNFAHYKRVGPALVPNVYIDLFAFDGETLPAEVVVTVTAL